MSVPFSGDDAEGFFISLTLNHMLLLCTKVKVKYLLKRRQKMYGPNELKIYTKVPCVSS